MASINVMETIMTENVLKDVKCRCSVKLYIIGHFLIKHFKLRHVTQDDCWVSSSRLSNNDTLKKLHFVALMMHIWKCKAMMAKLLFLNSPDSPFFKLLWPTFVLRSQKNTTIWGGVQRITWILWHKINICWKPVETKNKQGWTIRNWITCKTSGQTVTSLQLQESWVAVKELLWNNLKVISILDNPINSHLKLQNLFGVLTIFPFMWYCFAYFIHTQLYEVGGKE